MNDIFPPSHHTRERASVSEKTAGLECPKCEAAISRDHHHCAKCGAHLIVCHSCKSPNVELAQSCHKCGWPLIVAPAPDEVATILAQKTRLDILDQAALALVKLRDIIESIERLELAHQITCSQSVSIRHEDCGLR